MNKVILIGNIGKDPESKSLGDSTVAEFTLATNKKWKSKTGEQQSKTTWHNIKCWNKTAEIAAKYLKKGSQVCIEGEIEVETWEKDGKTNYKTVITCKSLQMLGGVNATPSTSGNATQTPTPAVTVDSSDELPF